MMDIRPTSEQALEYIWFGRQCLDLARRSGRPGAKAIQDGRLLVICKYTLHHATLITLSQGDFTMHPRSGPLRSYPVTDDSTIPGINGGGYIQSGNAFAEMSSRLPYPLVDNDHGTFVISIDGEDLEVEWAEAGDENYGNIWWQGTGDEPITLSWKGPPSVQFGLPSSASISGLTQSVSTGASTPFGCYIYQDGVRLCHGPRPIPDNELSTLVVGACYATDEEDKQQLVAICITNRDSRYFLQVWRSEDRGAEWELIEEFLSVRASSPAFIHRSGKVFVYAGVRYIISENLKYVLRPNEQMPASEKGTRTITGRGGYGSTYEFSGGVGYCWPAIDPNGELVFSEYTESASFTGTGNGDTQDQIVQVPVYRGNPATEVVVRPGYFNGFVFDAEPNGKYCDVQWSGVDRYQGTRAWKAAPKGCNTSFSVSVTLLPQGVTGSYTHEPEQEDMTISGPAAAYVGAQYSTSHAIAPVTWSISSGAIDETGTITELGCSPTVTAVDFCGRTASISTETVKVVSGPDTATLGAQYTVANSVGPVTWSISAGSISQYGVITATACGAITITATDSCGNANKVVRGVSGSWVGTEYWNSGAALCSCGATVEYNVWLSPTKYIHYSTNCCQTDEGGSCAPIKAIDTGVVCSSEGYTLRHRYIYWYRVYEFVC